MEWIRERIKNHPSNTTRVRKQARETTSQISEAKIDTANELLGVMTVNG